MNQYFYKNIISLSIRVLDLFFLENHDISIVRMFCQKKYYPLEYEFLQNFKIPLFYKKNQILYKNRDYYRKNRYDRLPNSSEIQEYQFFDLNEKK